MYIASFVEGNRLETNKVIVVFGASSGVGASCILKMKDFKKVYAVSRRGMVLDCNQNQMDLPSNVKVIKCDVTDYDAVESLLLSIDEEIDCVVSCVGVGCYAPINNNYSEKWKEIMNTNVLGNVNILSNVVRHHTECKIVIALGSIAAKRSSDTPGNEIYRASKVALEVFLNDFRRNLRLQKNYMKICILQPGFIDNTDFGRKYFDDTPEEAINLFSSFKSLSPDEVAKTIIDILFTDKNIDIGEIIIRPIEQPT